MAIDTGADFNLVDATFNAIARRDYATLTQHERDLLLIWHADGIIGNGGFRYFVEQRMPFQDVIEALRRVGIPEAVEVVGAALALFPSPLPVSDGDLARELNALRVQLDELGRRFWEIDNLIVEKLAAFVRTHCMDGAVPVPTKDAVGDEKRGGKTGGGSSGG